jgi:hypothetical protein
MANDNAVVGVDMKLEKGGSLIGTQTGGSLSLSPDLREIIVKNQPSGGGTDWKARLAGEAEWSVSHEGLLLNDSDEYDLANQNASMKLEYDVGNGSELIELPSLDSIDFTLSQELAETGGLDEPLWRYLRPAEREFSIDVSGTYVEPTTTEGEVYDEVLNTLVNQSASVPFELNTLGVTLTGNVALGDFELAGETGGEDATVDLSMASDLDLTKNGSFGTGIENIFGAFMNKNSVSVGMLHYDGSSAETGTKKISGSGYYSEVSISLSDGEEAQVSGTVEGDGAISLGTVS